MIVLIAGIKRSGSTAQFNIVRIALQQSGYKVNICGHGYTPRDVPKGEVDLVKRHPFSGPLAEAADHIFLTDRKNKEILKSLDRMWNSGDPNRIKGMRKNLDLWRQYTTPRYEFRYELLVHHKRGYVRRIIEILDVDTSVDAVLEEFDAIKLPEDEQDPVTLLFPNHIS